MFLTRINYFGMGIIGLIPDVPVPEPTSIIEDDGEILLSDDGDQVITDG